MKDMYRGRGTRGMGSRTNDAGKVDQESADRVFADPVSYLAELGIEAALVEVRIAADPRIAPLCEAA